MVDVRFCWTLSMSYLRQLYRLWNTCTRKLQVTGCLVLKQNIFILLLHGRIAGILLGLHSNSVSVVTRCTLTQKIF